MEEQNILIEEMKQLGLNQYEAKAYLTLLEEYPVNGYTLSKYSGVPRSRIYEVLEGLIKKQIVFERKNSSGITYYPLEPDLLIKKLKKNYKNIIDYVQKETTNIFTRRKNQFDSKIISGKKNIFEFIKLLIDNTKSRIDISIWEDEYNDIEDSLNLALDRGVKIKGIYFGNNNKLKDVISHRRLETYLNEKKERYIIIVFDQKEAVTGIISRGEDSQVTWTNDFGIIDITEDYIVHDLIINEYSLSLSPDEQAKYEIAADNVRKSFYK